MGLVKYLNPADHNSSKITKANKELAKKLFKDINFPVKIRDIHKIDQKNSISTSVFGYENKEKYPIYLIKDFNTLMYNHTLHRRKKHFCCYYLQAFSTEEILKCHLKDCFKINGKKKIIMPKEDEYVKFKNYERKIKSPFVIYADFESILLPEELKVKFKSVLYKQISKLYCLQLWL